LSERYILYIYKVSKGDLGKSYVSNRNVRDTILDKFPATAILAFSALVLSAIFGIFFGVIAAVKRNSFTDKLLMIISLGGISAPQFVLGLFFILIFGSVLGILPLSGYINNGIQYLILPAVTLAFRPLAIITRITKTSMLEVMNQDYIKTARAKGLSEFRIYFRHCLRNALNPLVTTLSAILAATLGGAFFVEYIFNWPGMGLLAIDSIMKLDFPMIQGTVLVTAVVFVIINLIVDVLYAFIDPKVKIS
ncbi:MAG TPA: ABC transporter permease, partial [Ignavibacteria bacterium]|nr:ABC transporter permease [Ignavibacteria bacterium]